MIVQITEFTTEALDEFIEKVNKLTAGEKLTILVATDGGSTINCDAYIHIINSLDNVEVIGLRILSSGFTLFESVNCKKSLVNTSYGMQHHASWNIDIGYEGMPLDDFDRFRLAYQKKHKNKAPKWMTEYEKKIYKEGRMVYLDRDRLRDIFKI